MLCGHVWLKVEGGSLCLCALCLSVSQSAAGRPRQLINDDFSTNDGGIRRLTANNQQILQTRLLLFFPLNKIMDGVHQLEDTSPLYVFHTQRVNVIF